jgi:hypothetical protein
VNCRPFLASPKSRSDRCFGIVVVPAILGERSLDPIGRANGGQLTIDVRRLNTTQLQVTVDVASHRKQCGQVGHRNRGKGFLQFVKVSYHRMEGLIVYGRTSTTQFGKLQEMVDVVGLGGDVNPLVNFNEQLDGQVETHRFRESDDQGVVRFVISTSEQ